MFDSHLGANTHTHTHARQRRGWVGKSFQGSQFDCNLYDHNGALPLVQPYHAKKMKARMSNMHPLNPALFPDKSAAWQAFVLTYSQIKKLSLNETTVFGFMCFIPILFIQNSSVGLL